LSGNMDSIKYGVEALMDERTSLGIGCAVAQSRLQGKPDAVLIPAFFPFLSAQCVFYKDNLMGDVSLARSF